VKLSTHALALVAALALTGCAGTKGPASPAGEHNAIRINNALALTLTTLSAVHDEAIVLDGAGRMAGCPAGDQPCRKEAGDKAREAARPRGAALASAVEAQHALKEALEAQADCRAKGNDACVVEQAAIVAKRLPELERVVAGLKGLVKP
jgi:hypothetical protein